MITKKDGEVLVFDLSALAATEEAAAKRGSIPEVKKIGTRGVSPGQAINLAEAEHSRDCDSNHSRLDVVSFGEVEKERKVSGRRSRHHNHKLVVAPEYTKPIDYTHDRVPTKEELEETSAEVEKFEKECATLPAADFDFPANYREYLSKPILTRDEELALAKKIRDGIEVDASIEELVGRNLKLAIKIARGYEHVAGKVPLADLIQEANIGLCIAATRYDPFNPDHNNAKFSTYAAWWVKQAVRRYISDTARDVRIPVNKSDGIRNVLKVACRLESTLGRAPKDSEIAEEMDIKEEVVKDLRELSKRTEQSLHAPVGDNPEDSFSNTIPDSKSNSVRDNTQLKQIRDIVGECLQKSGLSQREKVVIQLRFNPFELEVNEMIRSLDLNTDTAGNLRALVPDSGGMYTLEQIGTLFKITRERIRQLEALALKKMLKMAKKSGIYLHDTHVED